MKIIYKDQNSGRSHSGLQKLSLLLVMMLFGFTTAFGQCQKPVYSGNSTACVNDVTVYTITNFGGVEIPSDADFNWQVSTSYGTILNAGFDALGRPFVSVKWNVSTSGAPSAWIKANYTSVSQGCTINGDPFPVTVWDLPVAYNFYYDHATYGSGHVGENAENAFYCHGSGGVTLTLSNTQGSGFKYKLVRVSDDFVIEPELFGTNGAINFTNIVVENNTATAASSTKYKVVAINPQLCQTNMIGEVTVHKYAEPTVLFSVNGVDASTGSMYYFCYNETVEVKLSSIVLGDGPMDVAWEVFKDGSGTADTTLSGSVNGVAAGGTLFGPQTLDPGVYVVQLTSLVDANGCEPTDYSIYTFTITIWEEPTLEITIGGNSVIGSTLEYCYDDNIEFTVAGGDGIERWTFDWQVNYDLGALVPNFSFTGDSVDNTPEFKSFSASTLGPGTYKVLVTALSDGNNCNASPATIATYYIDLIIHPEPQADIVINGSSVGWNYNETFCFDQQMSFALGATMVTGAYPLQSITWTVSPEVPGIGLVGGNATNVGAYFDFNFTSNQLPADSYVFNITELTDANGCSPSSYAPYQAGITIRPEPELSIVLSPSAANNEYCWDDIVTITMTGTVGTAPWDVVWSATGPGGFTAGDAVQGSVGVWPIDLSTYAEGVYNFKIVSLSDAFPCSTSQATLDTYDFSITVLHKPAPNAGSDETVCNSSSYTLQGAGDPLLVGSTFLWTKVSGPGTPVFGDATSPTSSVEVDVAGTYVFRLTETNGACEFYDDVSITFLMGTDAAATTMVPQPDVSTIANTPVILAASSTYGDLTGTDPAIMADALIEGNFPDGVRIFKLRYKETGMPAFVDVPLVGGQFVTSSTTEFWLSDIVNLPLPPNPNTLLYHSNKTIDWEIFIDGAGLGPQSVAVTVTSVSYLPADKTCYAELASDDFTITTADAPHSLDAAVYNGCFPLEDPANPLVLIHTTTYPLIDVDSRVKSDAYLTSDVAFSAGAKLSIQYNAGPASPYVAVSGLTTSYLSDIFAAGVPNPLSAESSSVDVVTLRIIGLDPGTWNIDIQPMARLEYPSATYSDYEYGGLDVAKLVVAGSNGVTIDQIANVETVTGAPVIIPFTVNYALESNIDDSVLEDALFEVDAAVTILQITYGGSPQLGSPVAVAANTPTLLSDIMGSTPYPLNHQPGSTALWSVTVVADSAAAQTVTASILSIAYVDFDECYSELDEATVTVTWADFVQAFANTPAIVCDGSDVTGSTFTIQYPTISGNPALILADAEITCDEIIPAGVDIIWGYNAAPSTTYTLPAALNAGEVLKLSTIVGSSAPLNGHSGLTDVWNFTFIGLSALAPGNFYEISVQPIATLNSDDYDESTSNTPITQKIEIYGVPDATISGDAEVFSGSTHTYSVAYHPYNAPATYTWSSVPSSPNVIITPTNQTASIEFVWPFTGTVGITAKVSNGVCDDTKTFTVEVKPNVLAGQVKYYNSQESPMPSPFMMDVLGIQVPGYFRVELYSKNAPQTPIEEVMVQEIYGEVNDLLDDDVYEAAFMFDYNLDPTEDYFVAVYDDELGFFASTDAGYWTMNNWGGVTAVDALFVQHMAAGNQINGFQNMSHIGANNLTPAYGFFANGVGDVNSSGAFTALDALLTSRRAVGLIPFFTNNTPNFRVAGKFVDEADFNTPAVFGTTLPDIDFQRDAPASSSYESVYFGNFAASLGVGVHFLNIYYNATGDVNSSYVPAYGGFKAAPVMDLIFEGEIAATVGQEVTLPITLDNYAHLGAMGLGLNYRNDLIEVIGTSYGEDYARIDHENGTVAIAWADINGVSFDVDDAIVQLTIRILQPIAPGIRLYELNGFTELAEVDATIIYDVNFKSIGLNTSGVNGDFTTNVYPNPFNQQSVISYTLPEAGKVNVTIFNKLGQVVKTMVSENQAAGEYQVNVNSADLSGPGMYYYKVEFDGETQHLSATNNMILIR